VINCLQVTLQVRAFSALAVSRVVLRTQGDHVTVTMVVSNDCVDQENYRQEAGFPPATKFSGLRCSMCRYMPSGAFAPSTAPRTRIRRLLRAFLPDLKRKRAGRHSREKGIFGHLD
jgi:hypothetical protein